VGKIIWWLFFVILFIPKPCVGQYRDVDSFGNLYIITIDNSGSMVWNAHDKRDTNRRQIIAESVYQRLLNDTNTFKPLNHIHYDSDKFIFFNSGIFTTTQQISHLKNQPRFEFSFIHHTDTAFNMFSNKKELLERIKMQLATNQYEYCLSFVSQIRLFSLIKALNLARKTADLSVFHRIFVIIVTDDGDQNDQWMTDYETVKKSAPKKLVEIASATKKYLYNPFDPQSDYSKLGTFFETSVASEKPYIYFNEYVTGQSGTTSIKDSVFEITAAGNKTISLKSHIKQFGGNAIGFFHLNKIVLNGISIPVNVNFSNDTVIAVPTAHIISSNNISVRGYFQQAYIDPVLGKHYRKVNYIQTCIFYPKLLTYAIRLLVFIAVLVFAMWLLFYFVIIPNKMLFSIYCIHDKTAEEYIVKKGHWLYGHNYNFKPGEHTVLSYTRDNELKIHAIHAKYGNIKKREYQLKSIHEEFDLLIVSSSELSTDKQLAYFPPEMDIEGYHQIRTYHPLLKQVYRTSIRYHLCKIAERLGLRYTGLFKSVLNFVNRIWKRHYYTFSVGGFQEDTLGFSAAGFDDNTFCIRFNLSHADSNIDSNVQRNLACINYFYGQSRRTADCLIIINLFDDYVVWNVLKLNYQQTLIKIYHVFTFKQICNENINLAAEISANTRFLKKLARQSDLNIHKYLTIITRSDKAVVNKMPFRVLAVAEYTKNIYDFSFKYSVFPGFLYMVETRDEGDVKFRKLYSPFQNGLQNEIMTHTPDTGTYHLSNCFSPDVVEKGLKPAYIKRLSYDLFSFSYPKDMLLTIDPVTKRIIYADHNILFNDNKL